MTDTMQEVKLDWWEKVGHAFDNPYYREERDPTEYNSPMTDQPFEHRNYDIFGALAGVRNETIPSIRLAAGLPNDVTSEVGDLSDRMGADGHSHSWVTLGELKKYDQSNFSDAQDRELWQDLIDKLDVLVRRGRNDDDVRIVFFFDN